MTEGEEMLTRFVLVAGLSANFGQALANDDQQANTGSLQLCTVTGLVNEGAEVIQFPSIGGGLPEIGESTVVDLSAAQLRRLTFSGGRFLLARGQVLDKLPAPSDFSIHHWHAIAVGDLSLNHYFGALTLVSRLDAKVSGEITIIGTSTQSDLSQKISIQLSCVATETDRGN
jgi:hypothetical protein